MTDPCEEMHISMISLHLKVLGRAPPDVEPELQRETPRDQRGPGQAQHAPVTSVRARRLGSQAATGSSRVKLEAHCASGHGRRGTGWEQRRGPAHQRRDPGRAVEEQLQGKSRNGGKVADTFSRCPGSCGDARTYRIGAEVPDLGGAGKAPLSLVKMLPSLPDCPPSFPPRPTAHRAA